MFPYPSNKWSTACVVVQARAAMEVYDFITTNGACTQESYPNMGRDNEDCRACTMSSSIAGFDTVSAYNDNVLSSITDPSTGAPVKST
jgi:hypothetical protein